MTTLADLDAAIRSPALRTVFTQWQQARGTRLMPAWRDIDPIAIGRHLSKVWAWRYEAATGIFTGRLAGEEIIATIGTEIRGRTFAECFPAEPASRVEPMYRRVVEGPNLVRAAGHVYILTGGSGIGERLVLPLAEDGVKADGILGVTDYRLKPPEPSALTARREVTGEEIVYYPLT